MEQSCLNSKWLMPYLHCSIIAVSIAVSAFDQQVLLDFKSKITKDPFKIMYSWNSSLHYCNWTGITCNSSNERVMILDLRSQNLVGSIPPSIGNLTFLTAINLRNNSFHGEIPIEMGNLLQLQYLNLTWNYFTGTIPVNLSKDLRTIALEYNSFVGNIPDQLSSLLKLTYLGLGSNNLTGSIPAWIGNFSSLRGLSLAINNLQGPIPRDIGRLSNLEILQFYGNQLNGTIPQTIFNMTSVYYLSVTQNLFNGELPSDIGLTLPNLEVFAGAVNMFTGPIPVSLSNASNLGVIDWSQNKFTGNVPTGLGQLKKLYRLNFEVNSLGRNRSGDLRFLDFLVNCTNLQVFSFEDNFLGGELPKTIGNLSTRLEIFGLGHNMILGSVPDELGKLFNLTYLSLDNNNLRGNVPESLGKLRRLQGLELNGNKLSGKIPSSLGNLTSLTTLHIEDNELQGNIPPELGRCTGLTVLNLTGNNLVGSIPKELAGLSSLSIGLALANNSLTGSLPAEIGKLINLQEMDLSHNKLSGGIPSSLSSCVSLARFIANDNLFQGRIPESLKGLRGLEEVDLSHNNITGGIPEFLGKLPYLRKLDLSFNELEGEVPNEGIFANTREVSISGNPNLCGGPPKYNFPACPRQKNQSSKKRIRSTKIAIIISVTFLFLLLCSFAACYIVIRNTKKRDLSARSSIERQSEHFDDNEPTLANDPYLAAKITYQDIFKATNGFSEDNLVGTGSFGSVYKGWFEIFDTVTAVKVLNLQQRGALKSFMDECRALKSVRHRNLLKIVSACSSIDYQGNEFKCLVFEFMANGSLDDWLHSNSDEQYLNIIQRLNIAIDVASALDYLHNNCQVPIVHCDLKPSNILLDEEMTAHVGDFGLAKFLLKSNESWNNEASAALKGSIGYIPPEYGSGINVSTLGDVYSYGIMLLELFTGRRPTDVIFKDGLNIHQYVETILPKHVMEIADPSLLLAYEEHSRKEESASVLEEKAILQDNDYISQINASTVIEECLVSILKVGLLCSSSSPRDRMPIRIALDKIHSIRNLFVQNKRRNNSIR